MSNKYPDQLKALKVAKSILESQENSLDSYERALLQISSLSSGISQIDIKSDEFKIQKYVTTITQRLQVRTLKLSEQDKKEIKESISQLINYLETNHEQ